MNLNAHLALAQSRPQELRQEAARNRLALQARQARPSAEPRPGLNLRSLLVRLHLA